MTADEARGIVSDAREALRSVMRAINRPEPDWKAAEEAASECVDLCVDMEAAFLAERHRRKETSHD